MFVRSKFSFQYVEILFDVPKSKFIRSGHKKLYGYNVVAPLTAFVTLILTFVNNYQYFTPITLLNMLINNQSAA